MEFTNISRSKRRMVLVGGAMSAVLLTSCTGSAETNEAAETAPATTSEQGVTVVFDDLGGGYPDINVYQGTSDSAEDRTVSGTYLDGESMTAACVMEGRAVSSDPSVGEQARSSDQWLLLANSNVRQFATVVYIEYPEQVVAQLPTCP